MSKKIALVQLWLGQFPSYFDTHLQSCKNQNPNINFFIFTDQNININAPNIKVCYINEKILKNKVQNKTSISIAADISCGRKICDYRPLYGHIFEEYLSMEGLRKTLPLVKTIKEGCNIYYQYYTREQEQQYGILAIYVKKI